eukprot:scaffold9425_cov61-Phaeocystis_antarctica.AAC.1
MRTRGGGDDMANDVDARVAKGRWGALVASADQPRHSTQAVGGLQNAWHPHHGTARCVEERIGAEAQDHVN